jgi:hypothetical protein
MPPFHRQTRLQSTYVGAALIRPELL